MRYVLKTQPYEKNIAAGSFRYERGGVPTGVIEHWSLSHALDGYKFFRVDVDGRELKTDGYSTLYNVVLNPSMQPENGKFRHFTTAPTAAENGLRLKGQIVFDDDVVYVSREYDDERFEDEFNAPVGLSLPVAARWLSTDQPSQLFTLDLTKKFAPQIVEGGPEILETAESGFPIKVKFSDGVIAVSTRLAIYR